MNIDKKDLLNIVIRWLIVQLIGVILVFALAPRLWQAVLVLSVTSGLSLAFVIYYLLKRSPVKLKATDHPIELQIANETLPFMRRGLNEETAGSTAEIIKKISDVDAVAITDRERVLAYIGEGADHHKPGGEILTTATRQAIATGELKVIHSSRELNCPVTSCPLEAAVIVPLKCKGEIVGTVKMYQTKQGRMPDSVVKLAVGVAQLLGVQMELAELDRRAQLVTVAELDALHAQINPHFLFNTLNTIIMFSRTNPETARRLLIRLASFFRQALKRKGHFNTLKEEMEYINTYLVLVRARFREKIRVSRNIDDALMDCRIPVLTIQPLVENALKHGILPKEGSGTVSINVKVHNEELLIIVEDDGVGISSDMIPKVLQPGYGSGNGVGLSNVHERLKNLFGEEYGLRIISKPGKGTSVYVRVPMKRDIVR
ncbi:histidine kinase [Desulfolucanica intricata]|uniref:histidine kinase n=1 Tax=Desulfolucanica intricata TaxID=1285191 RepID=UPI000AA057C0|nr:histidine kinase [Desulfolucanica intricata]